MTDPVTSFEKNERTQKKKVKNNIFKSFSSLLTRFWGYFLKTMDTLAQDAMVDVDEKTRMRYYTLFLMIGIPVMVGFGIHDFLNGRMLTSIAVGIMVVSLWVSWFLLRWLHSARPVFRITSTILGLLLLYLLQNGGDGGPKSCGCMRFL